MQSKDYDALLISSIHEAHHHVWLAERNLPNRARFYLQIADRLLDEAPLKMSLKDQDELAGDLDELIDRLDVA